MKNALCCLLGFLLVFTFSGAASANLITNGSFDDGLNDWIVLSPDDFSINPGWGPYTNHLKFENGGTEQDGRLIQRFDIPLTTLGLNVSFDWMASFGESGNGDPTAPDIDPTSFFSSLVNVDLNNEGLFNFQNRQVILDTNETTGWTHVSLSFLFDKPVTDTSPNGRIRFEWNENSDWISNAKLDNIEVKAVPEPGTMLLLACGFIGLAAVGRRKIQKK